jgi:hypothetical protein
VDLFVCADKAVTINILAVAIIKDSRFLKMGILMGWLVMVIESGNFNVRKKPVFWPHGKLTTN